MTDDVEFPTGGDNVIELPTRHATKATKDACDEVGRMIRAHYARLLARPISPELQALADSLIVGEE